MSIVRNYYANSTVQGLMEISVPDADRLLTKVPNKRKLSVDSEIGNHKLLKVTNRRQKEFSMKVNLPNRSAPKNNGVKSFIGSIMHHDIGFK